MEGTSAVAGISVIDLIHQGWYATYPLILFSVIVTSIVIERVWLLSRLGGAIDSPTAWSPAKWMTASIGACFPKQA